MIKLLSLPLKIVVTGLVLAVIIKSSLPRYDSEEIAVFEKHREEFELVAEYVLENFDTEDKKIILVDWLTNEKMRLYDDGDIYPDKEINDAFFGILDAFNLPGSNASDLSHIVITPDRISFGGEGTRMYVLSRNGRIPNYYYHKGDGVDEKVYPLGDNWYLLRCFYR